MLLVVNKGDRSLSIVDVEARRQVAVVPVGGVTGHEVAASADGRTAYIPIYGDAGVGQPGTDGDCMVVVDIASRKVSGTVDFGKGVRPHLPVFDPVSGLLYVTTELQDAIAIVDPATLKVVGLIPTGQAQSHMLAISHDGRRGYVANVRPGTVSVLDLVARQPITVIPISEVTQRISISPDDKRVFTADQKQPRLAVIDTSTNRVETWVPLPGRGYGTIPTPDGQWLLVAMRTERQVAVVDLVTLQVAHVLDVSSAPQAIAVSPDGREAYVSCDAAGLVAVIDLQHWRVSGTIAAGAGADGLAWA